MTILGDEVMYGLGISIHTSAREVTVHGAAVNGYDADFNPHFRKGSDAGHMVGFMQSSLNFNPHFRKGSDSGKQ